MNDDGADRQHQVRQVIVDAMLIPPPRSAPAIIQRLPIRALGIAGPTGASSLDRWLNPIYLYRDINGIGRRLGPEHHHRDGIASLFAGERRLLLRLWPGAKAWNARRAAADLICWQRGLGLSNGLPEGFPWPLFAETGAEIAAHLGIGSLARRLLYQGQDPFAVFALARGWNTASGTPTLPADVVVAIVAGACARELRRQGKRDAA